MTGTSAPERSPWERYGWAMGAIWLVFLAFPVVEIASGDLPAWQKVLGLAAVAAYAVVYIHGLVRLPRTSPPTYDGLGHLAVMTVLAVAICLVAGEEGLSTLPYLVALGMFSLRMGLAVAVFVVALLTPVAVVRTGWAEPGVEFISLVVALVGVATGLVRVLEDREGEHQRVSRELDVVAERERVARDVHDVLGHSLTVVSAKAELAERVLDDDPARAKAELAQIQSLTREALAEIRATVAGLRVARLGAELDAAQVALAAAGIEARLPDGTDQVDPRHRLLLAWVLREAVTNVVRHSGAQTCTVTFGRNGMTVDDDGGGRRVAPEGNGLRGVRERVSEAGGTLSLATGPDGRGTRLEVTL